MGLGICFADRIRRIRAADIQALAPECCHRDYGTNPMMFLNQQRLACRVAFKGLRQRIGSSLVIVVGMTCVAGVTLAMLSLAAGLGRAIVAGGDSSHAIVSRAESPNGVGNALSRADVAIILNAPGIALGPDGRPLASAEVLQWLPPAPGFGEGTLYLLGIGPRGAAVRPGFAIVSGRMFRTGAEELIVGRGAESVFGLKIGSRVIMPNGEWPIVGEFSPRRRGRKRASGGRRYGDVSDWHPVLRLAAGRAEKSR
jgi:hypothetical protein